MALPGSGPLSFSAIATELLAITPYSLRSMSSTAGFSTPDAVSEFYGYSPPSSGYSYDSGTSLSWPTTSGYTVYDLGWNGNDDDYTSYPITLPTSFYMNGTVSTNLYVSTNGYATLDFGDGNIYSSPQNNDGTPPIIAGNLGDLYIIPGSTLTDGDVQNLWYQVNDEGSGKYNFKLLMLQGQYGDTSNPESYIINFYRDSSYQWMETRLKSNDAGGTVGPYNTSDVSQTPSNTTGLVWRGDLNGQNWVYQGFGRIV